MTDLSGKVISEAAQPGIPFQRDSIPKPYVGPVPFQKQDQGRFFGRDREADDLAFLIEANAVVLLYAQSGAGKSSLVNAKLIPMLEKERKCEVLPARPGRPLPHGVAPGVDALGGVFILNALDEWRNDRQDREELQSLSLKNFLGARPHQKLESDIESLRILIFDQFEEIFTSPYPQRSRDRKLFFQQLEEALEADHLLRVLFSIREEYIASLEPYAKLLPEGFRTRRRLERLRPDQAQLALCEPLRGTEYTFASDVVEALLRDLMTTEVKDQDNQVQTILDDFIEPVQLGVVCEFVWQRLVEGGGKVITKDLLVKSGDVNEALIEFYEDCIRKTVRETGADERKLRRFFHFRLITEYGTRGSCLKGEKETGDVPNKALESLDELHLIRSEWRASANWYELTHDRFISPIVKANQKWLKEALKPGELESSERLRAMTVHWDAEGRRPQDLLRNGDLARAEALLLSPYAPDMGFSTELTRSCIERSRESAHQRKLQALNRQKRWLQAVAVVAGIFLVLAGYGWWDARHNRITAEGAGRAAKVSADAAHNSLLDYQMSDAERDYQAARSEVKRKEDEIVAARKIEGTQKVTDLANQLENAQATLKTASAKLRDTIRSVGKDRSEHLNEDNAAWLKRLAVSVPNTRRRAEALASDAMKILASDPLRAVLLAKYAIAVAATPSSVGAFYAALAETPLSLDTGTPQQVFPVAFMGGDRILSGGSDGTARVWSVLSGQPIMILVGHVATIADSAMSPDNRYIGTASHDHTARIWNASDGAEIRVLAGHTGRLWGIAFSPDRRRVATAGEDKSVRVWNLKTGAEANLLRFKEAVVGLAFSPDGRLLAAAGTSGRVTLFDATTLRKRDEFKSHEDWIYRVAFSPDSSRLVTTSRDKTASIHHLGGKTNPISLHHDGMVGMAVFSHDGRRVATASADGSLRVWDSLSGKNLLQLDGKCGAMFGVAFSPDDNQLAGGCEGVKVWSLWGKMLGGGRGSVSQLALSRDGSLLASAELDAPRVWDRSTGWNFLLSGMKQGKVTAVSLSEDAFWVASGDSYGMVTVLSLDHSRTSFPLNVGGGPIRALAFSLNGRRLAIAADRTPHVWDLESTDSHIDLPGHDGPINAVAFAPDVSAIVTGGDRSATVWDLDTQRIRKIFSYGSHVARVDISPDGQWVAGGGGKNPIMLWKTNSAETVTLTPAMGDELIALRFSADGSRISAGSKDGEVKNWDLKTKEVLNCISGGGSPLGALDFSADRSVVAFAGTDGKIWTIPLRIDIPSLLSRARSLSGRRDLTSKECNDYLGSSCPIP